MSSGNTRAEGFDRAALEPKTALRSSTRAPARGGAAQRALSFVLPSSAPAASTETEPEPTRENTEVQPLSVQRQATGSGASAPPFDASSEATAAPEADSGATELPGLLVEDTQVELRAGQARKSEFLAQAESAVCLAINEELAAVDRSAEDCAYLVHWFAFYARQSSSHVEATLLRYAPAARQATSASGYIAALTARAREAASSWLRSGQLSGAPDPRFLTAPDADAPDATLAGAGTDTTAIPSSSAASPDASSIQYERGAGAEPRGSDQGQSPRAILGQLGAGRPLEAGVRSRLEPAVGIALSSVRVHTDSVGARLSAGLSARAFTVGEHIAFAPGEFRPGTPAGDVLLAHELAHVAQQRAGSIGAQPTEQARWEHEADRSAFGTLISLWGGEPRSLPSASGASSGWSSGLKLQRCDKASSGPIGASRLTDAQRRFRAHNSGSLSAAELTKIDAAIATISSSNVDLGIAFYDYYTTHDIEKMNPTRAAAALASGLYAETRPNSDTIVRPDILAPSFPSARLGALLIHEFTHTRHHTNFMGTSDYEEGDSYGIEYFFARRSGDTTREAEITALVLGSPTSLTMPIGVPALQSHFYDSYHAMKGLYEIIDSGSTSHPGSPFDTPTPLTAAEARALVAELVSQQGGSHGTRLTSIMAWIHSNASSLAFP